MANELPTEFDLVVMGTGFTESCIAAGASRSGKSVLHLDREEFYGGAWASFNLENFIALMQKDSLAGELQNATHKWHVPNKENENKQENEDDKLKKLFTQTELLEKSRRFNLDLCPKILYGNGSLVKLLISSNICRYGEFRAIDHVLTRYHEELLNVPCSRADVFNSRDLTIIEKRLLMKVLSDCRSYGKGKRDEDEVQYRDKTFHEYLLSQKVTEKIVACIGQAIVMCNEKASYEEGMSRMQIFLDSLGRYGNTPFLFPMYGCGEIPQCFCRLCAVFGGTYCLKCPVDEIIYNVDTNTISVRLENGKIIQAKHVVTSHGNLPTKIAEHICGDLVNKISRGLFICANPLGDEIFNTRGGGVNLLRLVAAEKEAIVLQLSHFSGVCPKETYVFHVTTPACSNNPANDLEPFISQIFNDKPDAPTLLFSAYFTLTDRLPAHSSPTDNIPIYRTDAPYYELDYDLSIKNAREIFNKMYPGAEFLPRAPDPEEIIVDGEDPRALNEVSLPEDLRAQLHQLECSDNPVEIDSKVDTKEEQSQRIETE